METPAARPPGQQAQSEQAQSEQAQSEQARSEQAQSQEAQPRQAQSQEAGRKRTDIAFLVAQLGAYAAERFGERAAALDFTRPQAGLLRLISREPGQSQQAVARRLGTPPSRLVALVDGLEQRGLIERRRNPGDRRNYALHPTAAGEEAMTV